MVNNIRDKMIPEEFCHWNIHNLDLKYTLDWEIIINLFSVCTILAWKKSSCYENRFINEKYQVVKTIVF